MYYYGNHVFYNFWVFLGVMGYIFHKPIANTQTYIYILSVAIWMREVNADAFSEMGG